jgi:hypothetical protein
MISYGVLNVLRSSNPKALWRVEGGLEAEWSTGSGAGLGRMLPRFGGEWMVIVTVVLDRPSTCALTTLWRCLPRCLPHSPRTSILSSVSPCSCQTPVVIDMPLPRSTPLSNNLRVSCFPEMILDHCISSVGERICYSTGIIIYYE